ncbi:MAG: hypothetical protein AB7T01_08550 [Acidithiobacillus sp.]
MPDLGDTSRDFPSEKKHAAGVSAEITLPDGRDFCLLVPPSLFDLLCESLGNANKARSWLEGRIMEVANLSHEAIGQYLNLMIRQRISASADRKTRLEGLQMPRVELHLNGSVARVTPNGVAGSE